MQEVALCVQGKPDRAGGPMADTPEDTRKPVDAGGHIVHDSKAQRSGGPAGASAVDLDG